MPMRALIEAGRAGDAVEMLTEYVASTVARLLATVRDMLAGRPVPAPQAW